MVDSPAEIPIYAVGDAEIEESVVIRAGCLAAEAVCPSPIYNSLESFEFIGMVSDLAQFFFGFVDIVGGGSDVDVAEPDHGVFGGTNVPAELFKSIEPR